MRSKFLLMKEQQSEKLEKKFELPGNGGYRWKQWVYFEFSLLIMHIILLITEQHNQVEKLLQINKYKPFMEELDKCNDKNREFVCSCSKAYLSYAALFTHIKHKHNGQAPGPIIRPRSQRKRGRPKKSCSYENASFQDIKIMSSIGFSSPNKNLFDKQLEIIQQGEIKNGEQRTRQSTSLLGCGELQTFKPFGFSSAFSIYNSQIPQNSLQRFKSETIHQKHGIPKQKQYDSDYGSEKASTPKTIPSEKIQQNFYNSIIQRLKELCSNLNSNDLTILKVSFQYSRAYQTYLRADQPLPNQDNILNKIRIFNNFVKDNTHDEHYYQIMIIVVLALDNILQAAKQSQYLLTDSLQSFIEYIHMFFETGMDEQIRERKLQMFGICSRNNCMQIFIEFFNYLSLNSFVSLKPCQGQIKQAKMQDVPNTVY